jgi:hypothetical protein
MGALRTFLIEHPALIWRLGFRLVSDPTAPYSFHVAASVPSDNSAGYSVAGATVYNGCVHRP